MAYFLALPSVKTLKLGASWEQYFDWPAHLPKSNVEEITFVGGEIHVDVVYGLCHGIKGPCKFTNQHGIPSRIPEEEDSMWSSARLHAGGRLEVFVQDRGSRWL